MSQALEEMPFDVLVDTHRAAELLNTTEPALRQHRVRGTGPRYVRQGRSVRYRVVDLAAYEDARDVGEQE